jgi:hypothetical protein
MIVPSFWAEAKEQGSLRGRQFTVRRFGWSDESAEAAAAHAAERAHEAVVARLAGQEVTSHDRRRTYGGEEGLPIREEILERRGEALVTRNTYGARCLNTPDVLFADVDYADLLPRRRRGSWLMLVAGVVLAYVFSSSKWAALAAAATGIVGWLVLRRLGRTSRRHEQGLRTARTLVRQFLETHRGWALRLYGTPAGLRIIAVHRRFAPEEPAVTELFTALHADPRYVQLCRLQRCFRARLTAKPWRIGIKERIRPRPGIWPITNPEHLRLRTAWVANYERVARGFAACRLLEELGDGTRSPEVVRVVAWHDELCGALGNAPLA